ncbi:sulfurtransferase [Acetobacteraceae bacterium KSS8]|uniref:Sulfurtransferase n=1 Tax=Endosaccharibacter trunci TaxID=2812733 RepID=A0ABT1W1Z6_9PROT|nr:sulfurtransferase [Acetobacteraceae bacterium KSS8]
MGPLVSTEALAALIADAETRKGVVILDATALLPGQDFDPEVAFHAAHIPGARRFDIELFSDPDTALPHMVPSQGRFGRLFAALGVDDDSEVVFYDQTGLASAARGWWLAGLFGLDRVRVLDGGLPAWLAENRPTESGAAAPVRPGSFVPRFRAGRLVGLGDMLALSREASAGGEGAPRLLDARSAGRFAAEAPEPRAGLPGGHVPGARSLPFGELMQGTHLKPAEMLRARFAAAGVAEGDRVVTSCGSGLTASVLTLALVEAGLGHGALYDGSWTEWAQAGAPRATGAGGSGAGG